ncbi:MAG: DUF4249 family protein [Candidatus Eisenbacteria bacterium]|nr:DUF4249 family protein [Candidatus Eisenbacteria bacterium]
MALMAGCSTQRDDDELFAPDEVGVIVVDARLLVDREMSDVRLRLTQPPGRIYDEEEAALRGAVVTISSDTTITFREVAPGRYQPDFVLERQVILPNTRYDLYVAAPDGRVVTATTTTPDRFSVREWLRIDLDTGQVIDTLATSAESPPPEAVYQANRFVYQDGLIEARFERVNCAAYQVALKSLDEGSPLVIDADFLSDEEIAELTRDATSPPFDAREGSIRLPWFAVFFEGRHRFLTYAIDRNWYDLIRTTPEFGGTGGGFGGNAGDNFERPIFHVEGGIGLFGSGSMDEAGFYVLPKP